jgi:glucose/arabinose dehydrogenase
MFGVAVWPRPWFVALCLVSVCCTAARAEDATQPYGISHRSPWTRSRVVGSPEPPTLYRTARVFERLETKLPLYLAPEPGTNRLIVVEHLQAGGGPGRLRRFENRPDAHELETLLDLNWLIYGLTFHPRFVENGYVYLMTNGPVKPAKEEKKRNRIVRFTIDRKPPHHIDPQSELAILEFESDGHNGGDLGFGPDGLLYCPTGDGTSDSDPLHTGQGLNDLLAVMLRIDVDHPSEGRAYSIPPDNPFLTVPEARPEIWAFGFRNPWRMAFDRHNGQLWVTQNGQDLWEQVYLVRKGENYGWSVQEGSHPFYLDRPRGPGEITPPVAEHHHHEARSLTGGVVYYGGKLPELQGAYIYGDYSTGRVWGIRHDGAKVTWHQELVDTPFAIVGFTETQDGELLVVDQQSGFYRLEPQPQQPDRPPFPTKLSETGLFADVASHTVDPAVIPYSVNAALWSDGAHKDRFLALPGWSQIEFPGPKSWNFPEGTVLVKTFSLDLDANNAASRRRVETRLITKQQNEWVGYSYLWNEAQTEAELVGRAGFDRDFTIRDPSAPGGQRVQTWHYPSRTECMVCHSRAATFVLGLQTEQMNRVHDYGDVSDNQLRTLDHLGLFRVEAKQHGKLSEAWPGLMDQVEQHAVQAFRAVQPVLRGVGFEWPQGTAAVAKRLWSSLREKPKTLPWLPKPAADYAAFPDPHDAAQPLEQRARAYLHVNCAVCHQAAGGGNAQIELQFATVREKMNLIDAAPYHDKFGQENMKLVAPDDPAHSMLLTRMTRRGRGQMPPLATSLVDAEGVKLLEAWIRELPPAAKAATASP